MHETLRKAEKAAPWVRKDKMQSNVSIISLKNSGKKKEKQPYDDEFFKKEKGNKPRRKNKREAF